MPDGNKLRGIMQEKGVSQYRLAHEIGIDPSYMNVIIKENKNVKEDTLFKICDTLGCTAEEIRR